MFSTAHENEILLLMACKTTTTKTKQNKKTSPIQDACRGTDLTAEQQDGSWAGG